MSLLYLASIVVPTICMGLLDHRHRVFLFDRPRRALVVLGFGVALFLVWDLVAIANDMYRRGESPAMTGIELAPDLPLEELFFIVFLCYFTMVLHGLLVTALRRRSAAGREAVR